jgi:hypothetical protein
MKTWFSACARREACEMATHIHTIALVLLIAALLLIAPALEQSY